MVFSDTGIGSQQYLAFRAGADARIQVINANGGINGRRVTYDWRDDGGDQSLNLSAATDLVEEVGVLGILQAPGTGPGSAAYLDEKRVPVTGFGSDPDWSRHDNMFSWLYLGEDAATTWGDFIRSRGGTRAAVFNVELNASGVTFNAQYLAGLRAAGVEIVQGNWGITPQLTNLAPMIERMRAERVDTIAGVITPPDLARLLPALREAGVEIKVALLLLGYSGSTLHDYGQALAGSYISISFQPFENTAVHAEMQAAMRQYEPHIQPPTQDSAVWGWLAADLLLRGVRDAGACPTRDGVVTALSQVRGYDGTGLLPHAVDPAPDRGQTNLCYSFGRVSDDGTRFEPLEPMCGRRVDLTPDQ
ncbi:MAG: ABC transporter substrate-binding protein [Frankia sp.]|nr:ABC transporter substrate-binding protein [Frankia sp.]